MDSDYEGGLGAAPIKLTKEQMKILGAHERLRQGLEQIEYPKSGRWESIETAIAVLEALGSYLSTMLDEQVESDEITIVHEAMHTTVLRDITTHFRQAKWGSMDPRLAPDPKVNAGAAHDDATVSFKMAAITMVNAISDKLKNSGVKNRKAAARAKVVEVYRQLDIKFVRSVSSSPQEVTVTLLESWEKRWEGGSRHRAS